MNAKILVRIKPEVLDPQGDAVRKALVTLGFVRYQERAYWQAD